MNGHDLNCLRLISNVANADPFTFSPIVIVLFFSFLDAGNPVILSHMHNFTTDRRMLVDPVYVKIHFTVYDFLNSIKTHC